MTRLLIVDAMEIGRGASSLLWAVDRLRLIRSLGLQVVPLTPCESGYRPRGEGWTERLRAAIEEAHEAVRNTVPDAVGWAIEAVPSLSVADEASLTEASMSLGVPLLVAEQAAALGQRSWIFTGTGVRGRMMRTALRGNSSRIGVIGPWGQPPRPREAGGEVVTPPADVGGSILVVAGSNAMAGSLDPVAARLRDLSTHPVHRMSTDELPERSPGSSPRLEMEVVGNEPVEWSATKRLMARTALAAGKELLRSGHGMRDQVMALKEWLRQSPPSLIIVGNDRVGPGAALVCAARSLGIRTLSVQDGVAADEPLWWIRHAEWTASNGTQLRDLLVARGAPGANIRITGQPRYGPLEKSASSRRAERQRERAALPRRGSPPVVLVALQDKHDVSFVRELLYGIAILAELRPVNIIVRPHPSSNVESAEWLPPDAKSSQRWVVDSTTPAMEALEQATIVVGQYSTMLAEAAARGIPVVSFHPAPAPVTLDLSACGVAQSAGNTEDLVLRCLDAIDGRGPPDDAPEAALALLGALDGRSEDRVAAFALEILKA